MPSIHDEGVGDEALAFINRLTGLEEIDLSDCSLTDAVAQHLNALRNLNTITLSAKSNHRQRVRNRGRGGEGSGKASAAKRVDGQPYENYGQGAEAIGQKSFFEAAFAQRHSNHR